MSYKDHSYSYLIKKSNTPLFSVYLKSPEEEGGMAFLEQTLRQAMVLYGRDTGKKGGMVLSRTDNKPSFLLFSL